MAKNSENPNESSKIVRRLIPLCSRSDSVARCFRKPYAIALRLRGRVGVGGASSWLEDRLSPTRRALARNCAAERGDLPRKRER
jgi:hypothetical protein